MLLDPRPFPYQVSLSYQCGNSLQGYEYCDKNNQSRNIHFNTEPNEEFWDKFKEYLKTAHREKSIVCRLSYAKKYYQILMNGDATEIQFTTKDKKLQIMKSLAILSKYLGCYDRWKMIKERYQLKWSNENSVDTFKKIISEDNSFDNLLEWLKYTSSHVSATHKNILIYCTLTGLRPDEACQSIRLVKENINNYHDKEKMILKHFEFPDTFIRRTKQAYVSIANDLILQVANDAGNYSYNALRCHLRRKNIAMNMNYCRKIFATFLRNNGVQSEIVDLLQGRLPKSVFVRHYYLLTKDYNKNTLSPLLYKLYDVIA
jgi:intergrase/recombinase